MEELVRGRRAGAVAVLLALPVLLAACGEAPRDRAGGGTPDTSRASGAEAGDAGPADGPAEAPTPWTPELAAELREMGRADQRVREGLGPEAMRDTAFLARMARTDSAHGRRLRELVERHGWPAASDVGEEAAEAAFLIVQHTPFTPWQRRMLPRVEEAVRRGELDPQDFALLFDRVRVRAGEPQRYGTQLDRGDDGRLHLEPLEDTAAVDSLRAGLGLPPLDTYFDLLEEATGMTVAREGIRP